MLYIKTYMIKQDGSLLLLVLYHVRQWLEGGYIFKNSHLVCHNETIDNKFKYLIETKPSDHNHFDIIISVDSKECLWYWYLKHSILTLRTCSFANYQKVDLLRFIDLTKHFVRKFRLKQHRIEIEPALSLTNCNGRMFRWYNSPCLVFTHLNTTVCVG